MTRATRISVFGRGSLSVPGAFLCLLLAGSFAQAAEHHHLAQVLRDGGEVTSGDLNGDRLSDLVLMGRGYVLPSGSHHTLEIRLSGGLAENQTFRFPSRHGGLTAAVRDVDGDLDLDLVVTSRLTGEGLGILINNGRGVFSEGALTGRKPWVWGRGQRLVGGHHDDSSSGLFTPGSEDAAAEEIHAEPVLFRATRTAVQTDDTLAASVRGAFYIRPPPAVL